MELSSSDIFLASLVSITLLLSGINTIQLNEIKGDIGKTGTSYQEISLPEGIPDIYGEELGVSFSDVSREKPNATQRTIATMARLDRINLTESERQRLVDIAYEMHGGISCEYCCEAKSIVTRDGGSGCGCSHAYAMRGLAKYLITEHPEMSDKEIFQELSKWKVRYFPEQTRGKSKALQDKGVKPTYVNLASNEYRGISSQKGGWVGDC